MGISEMKNDDSVTLSLRYRGLTSLPPSIGQPTNLQRLGMTGNQLTYLPDTPGNLIHLEALYLDESQWRFPKPKQMRMF
jgi:Leucine-rich repeat (LRR) protein